MKPTQINLGFSSYDCINVLYSRQYYLGGTIGQVLKLNIFKNKSLFIARVVHINNTCTLYGVEYKNLIQEIIFINFRQVGW